MRRFGILKAALLAALILAWPQARLMAAEGTLTAFGAASLKNAMDEIDQAYATKTKVQVKASYAGSSALAKQIEQGAPVDVFISADQDWMNYLADRSLIEKETRTDLLANRIVLVAAKDFKTDKVEIGPGFDPSPLLAGGRLAMGQVDSVPCGKYGKAALEKLGAWPKVKDHLAQSESVRAALALVARGEAPLGIVYATDATAEPGVKIIGTFPLDSHPPIIYPAAILKDAANESGARDYLTFLRSPAAKAAFERQGFTVLDGTSN
ncbi:molybdate transport system substrate-binding protein [Arboricoccus pini]|uniref:Molybdate transport system substrate-binding protein n=2 Tax=Arboricoccus pini TaxID=1963835 RepID=A0A212RZR2_9PROT|nr:molybdate transport system substrate-binding protein [Arboricoccus pini]